MSSYQEKRRMELAKRSSIDAAYRASLRQKAKPKTLSEDSLARLEIQNYIRELCSLVKTRSKILEILNNAYSDSKYDKYRQYFEFWVNDVLSRMGHVKEKETQEAKDIEDEER